MSRKYSVAKANYQGEIVLINYEKLDGYTIKPKNNINYNGIKIDSMMIVKPSFIEKIIKKKNQKRLDYYLKYIMTLIDEDDESHNSGDFREALDSLERFKSVVEYKYQKYLDDKYINILLKKIDLIERELKTKMLYKESKQEKNILNNYEPQIEETRRRSR